MRTIFANNQELIRDKKSAYLSDDIASGVSSFNIDNIAGFAVNQILMIVEPGNESAEIVKTHAATAPANGVVTLASATKFAHPQGTRVYIIDWDQVEFSWGAGTIPSVVLSTTDIQSDQEFTQYTDNTYSSGNYFIRFKNTITTTFSSYSDPIPWGGFAENSVGAIIEYAYRDWETRRNLPIM